ncbi:MAG: hypothetical protein ABJA76_03595 [Mucilaginibacter sp.]
MQQGFDWVRPMHFVPGVAEEDAGYRAYHEDNTTDGSETIVSQPT